MFKVVYLPDQENIVVDLIKEQHDITVNGAALLETDIEKLPEVSQDVKQHIKDNPYQSFKLHKVENGQVVCRTVEDLQNLPFAEWERSYDVVEPEPPAPPELTVVENEPAPEEEPPTE